MDVRGAMLIVLVAISTVTPAVAQGSREAAPVANAATGSISGVVVDGARNEPVRRALVSAASGSSQSSQTHTDDAGRFRLTRLAPGSYGLFVSASSYVSVTYGAPNRDAPGRTIALTSGQQIDGIRIALTRTGVIAGVITAAAGEPLPNVVVSLARWGYSPQTGERALVRADVAGATTDDRGRYRIFDLLPGEYFVMTTSEAPLHGFRTIDGGEPLPVMRHADVEAVRLGVIAAPPRPGSAAPRAASGSGPRIRSVPTFYPGSARVAGATPIRLDAGEVRTDVDFAVQSVPYATISGTVLLPGGVTVERTTTQILAVGSDVTGWHIFDSPNAARDPSAFTFGRVPPGEYVIAAQVVARSAVGAAGSPELWSATYPLVVDGQDIAGIALSPRPGVTVSGQVMFPDGAPHAEVAAGLRIGLTAIVGPGEVHTGSGSVPLEKDGRFRVTGLQPGRYRVGIAVERPPTPSGSWWLKSAVVRGIDVADVPLDVGAADVGGVIVTLTQRPGSISGALHRHDNQPVPGQRVIAFSTDPAVWLPQSRRIRASRTASDGRFMLHGLPAGEYFLVVAGADVEDGQWFHAAFLRQLVSPAALRITLADGEIKVQDLRVVR
jgi:hypothetical protein